MLFLMKQGWKRGCGPVGKRRNAGRKSVLKSVLNRTCRDEGFQLAGGSSKKNSAMLFDISERSTPVRTNSS